MAYSIPRKVGAGFYPCAVLCLVMLLQGCEPSSHSGLDHSRFRPELLTGTVFNAAPVIGRPSELRSSGGWLWIKDSALDPALHVLDLATGDLLRSFGRSGEGPGEFVSRPQLHVRPGDDAGAVWTWDSSLRRLTRFDGEAPLEEPLVVTVESALGEQPPWRIAWIEPDRIVGFHPSQESRFLFFSSAGERLGSRRGELLGPPEIPINTRIKETMGGFFGCPWPGRGFAMIYFRVGRIEYYDLDARLVRLADVPFPSEAFLKDGDGNYVPQRDRDHYRSCAVHGDLLFAAFSGRRAADFEPGTPEGYASEFVHVFDWQGELRKVYRLDPVVHAIDIPTSGGFLLGASLITAEIYRFLLPEPE